MPIFHTGLRVPRNIFRRNSPGIGGYGRGSYEIMGNDFYANRPDYRSPFRAVDDPPPLAGKNMALDPRFGNPAEPVGPDGRFFTEDDGFVSALVGTAPGPTAEAPTLGCLPSRVKPE